MEHTTICNTVWFKGMTLLVGGSIAIASLAYAFDLIWGSAAHDVTATINVTGEGEVLVVPDIGTFTFSVVSEADTASAAQDSAAEQHNAIIDYLREMGVQDADIKTLGYTLQPRYRFIEPAHGGARERELIGYEVRQTVEVMVRDTEQAGKLLVGAGERGATNISNLRFTIDDESVYLDQARALAIKDAQTRAEQLAAELGVRVVRVLEFSEDSFPSIPFMARSAMMADGAMESATVPELPVGENTVESRVTITYEVR